eukprot:NODE_8438_length_397_cov_12.798851_g7956_i0.p1 GENE.NODE_8438_length_397_cov_12.798851_g7956_i0~~NODE_8438_length_397_cov_12.798851_g7956_i0.p1  ORF type:complete len:103 (-),score=5.37 NODE_8438_length_397_cov_12.798851_g7956_i0:3-311(-)
MLEAIASIAQCSLLLFVLFEYPVSPRIPEFLWKVKQACSLSNIWLITIEITGWTLKYHTYRFHATIIVTVFGFRLLFGTFAFRFTRVPGPVSYQVRSPCTLR